MAASAGLENAFSLLIPQADWMSFLWAPALSFMHHHCSLCNWPAIVGKVSNVCLLTVNDTNYMQRLYFLINIFPEPGPLTDSWHLSFNEHMNMNEFKELSLENIFLKICPLLNCFKIVAWRDSREKNIGSEKYCGSWMKIFLCLLKYTDFILLQATSEDYLQLPVIASVVSSISSASRTWQCLKTHCSMKVSTGSALLLFKWNLAWNP